jgi:ferredoxin
MPRRKVVGAGAGKPELFTLDDDGYANLGEREVPPGMEDLAPRGELTCPERTITIES